MRSPLIVAITAGLAVATLAAQQTPPLTPDIPDRFDAPTNGYDYVKRDVMIPMRDGVKLHTVIVVPKGARNAPDAADANAIQRLRSRATQPVAAHGRDAAAVRRALRRRRLHPRLSGRSRQVRIRRRVRDDAPAARAAEHKHRRSLHRRVRHDRLAGEERARIERPRRHGGQLVRGIHRGHGARESASGAQGGCSRESDGRRLDGRRLVSLRRVPADEPRLLRRPDHGSWRGRRPSCARATTTTRTSGAPDRQATSRKPPASISFPGGARSPSIRPTTRSGRRRRSTR